MFTFTSTYSISLLHLFMKQVQRNCLQNWEKTVLQKQEMSLEGLSQWERDFHLSLFTPPLPHPLTLLHTHSPFQPLSQGASHCHRWNHGVEDQQEDERGPKTKRGGTSQETLPPQHTAVSGNTPMHTLTCTHSHITHSHVRSTILFASSGLVRHSHDKMVQAFPLLFCIL